MKTKNNQIIFSIISCLLATLVFSYLHRFVTAQENQPSSKIGICKECCNTCRKSFYSGCLLSPVMIDGFEILNHETEMARLDKFAQIINSSPESDAYIVIYGGKINKFGELEQRLNRIKKYLIDFRKLDSSRIIFVKGGFREKFEFELWIAPSDKMFPLLTPTVEREKVVFRGKMKPLPVDMDYDVAN